MTTEQNSQTPVNLSNAGTTAESARSQRLLLPLAYLGFISLGLPDAILGVAWPSIRDSFLLPQSGLGLVSIALGFGYLLSSFFSGKLTLALGTGTLLAASSLLVAAAMFGNAMTPFFPVFLVCAWIWGLGSGAIDGGLNAYVAHNFSARHVNWLHAFYSLGATAGPLIMTGVLVVTGSWRHGYALVGSLILALAIMFLATRRRWDMSRTVASSAETPAEHATILMTLRSPLVQLQIILFLLYTGLELTIGQWAFTVLKEGRAVQSDVAGVLVGVYFGAIGVGRVVYGSVAERIGLDRLVRLSLVVAFLGSVLLMSSSSKTLSAASLTIIGFGLAPIYPCLMAQTPRRLPLGYAAHAIGFQVAAAMLGAAVAPAIGGLCAEWFGLEAIPRYSTLLAMLLLTTHEWLIRTLRNATDF